MVNYILQVSLGEAMLDGSAIFLEELMDKVTAEEVCLLAVMEAVTTQEVTMGEVTVAHMPLALLVPLVPLVRPGTETLTLQVGIEPALIAACCSPISHQGRS